MGREGKILLVDDNEFVRNSARRMLKRLGYDVEFVKDGAEGIRLYEGAKKDKQPFDVVIMDLTIPGGMGGKEAIKELQKIDPRSKVIVSSRYSDDEVMSKFRKYGFSGILIKPYKIEEVDEAIRRVMKGAS